MPPLFLREEVASFEVAEGLDEWVRSTILQEGHRLYNRDHAHLVAASIGWLWTNHAHTKAMRTVAESSTIAMPS